MAKEIERKYLMQGDAWRALPVQGESEITQAYMKPVAPVFINFDKGAVVFSFHAKDGTIDFTVPHGPDTDDFAAIRGFPNYDASTGRLNPDDGMAFRIRTIDDDKAFVTIKRPTGDAAVNDEYELPIPYAEARRIQSELCEYFVAKKRHMIEFQDTGWEVDVFAGALDGLVIAEVETADIDTFKSLPMLPGVAGDVTDMKGISNYALGRYGIPPALKNRLAPGKPAPAPAP